MRRIVIPTLVTLCAITIIVAAIYWLGVYRTHQAQQQRIERHKELAVALRELRPPAEFKPAPNCEKFFVDKENARCFYVDMLPDKSAAAAIKTIDKNSNLVPRCRNDRKGYPLGCRAEINEMTVDSFMAYKFAHQGGRTSRVSISIESPDTAAARD